MEMQPCDFADRPDGQGPQMKTVTLPIATTLALLLAACAPQTAYEKFKAGQPLQNFPYKNDCIRPVRPL